MTNAQELLLAQAIRLLATMRPRWEMNSKARHAEQPPTHDARGRFNG